MSIKIEDLSNRLIKDYTEETVLQRALPSAIDGLLPVQRRVLWSMYKLGAFSDRASIKSTRIIGETMGKYHPHGSSGIYGGIIGLCQSQIKDNLIDGVGNFGDYTTSAASATYTEARLSPLAEKLLLNEDYLRVIPYTVNYDGTMKEPCFLPAMLPIQYLIGNFGIAIGTTNNTPVFTISSLVSLIKAMIRRKTKDITDVPLISNYKYRNELNPKPLLYEDMCKRSFSESLKPIIELVGRNKFKVCSLLTPGSAAAIMKLPGKLMKTFRISSVEDIGDANNGAQFLITVSGVLKGTTMEAVKESLEKLLSARQTYCLNFVDNSNIKDSELGIVPVNKYMETTILDSIWSWLQVRIDLEKKLYTLKTEEEKTKLKLLNTKLLIADRLQEILNMIPKSTFLEDLKNLGLDDECIENIQKMTVRDLRALNKEKINKEISECSKRIKDFSKITENPEENILYSLDSLVV